MKSEYSVLLPNDICCSLQSLAAIAFRTKKLWRKICHSKMLKYYLRSHLKQKCVCEGLSKISINFALHLIKTNLGNLRFPSFEKGEACQSVLITYCDLSICTIGKGVIYYKIQSSTLKFILSLYAHSKYLKMDTIILIIKKNLAVLYISSVPGSY